MKVEEIIKLVNAGYTKEEINNMVLPEVEPETEVIPEEPKPATEETVVNSLQVMTEGISKAIIQELQKQNVMNSNQKEDTITPSEDIIATVLNLFEEKGE